MTIKPLEPASADRCATEIEIYQAGATQRVVAMDGSLEESHVGSPGKLQREATYCELRSETGEWVQFYVFELEFFAALDEGKKREPAAN